VFGTCFRILAVILFDFFLVWIFLINKAKLRNKNENPSKQQQRQQQQPNSKNYFSFPSAPKKKT